MKKKPSSAKRSIQQQAFSPFISSKRLESVQSLIRSDKNKEDTILLVLGIDSRYNEGCRDLANYLLFGFYDLRLAQFEESGIPEEELEDLIILIRATSIAVYCSGVLYSYLLPYIAHWRNLEIFSLPQDELESTKDEEKEEFKIRSFVSMLHGSVNIGIPYWTSRGLGLPSQLKAPVVFDKFAIEKWPLIQSYAVEGVGGGTFFTMRFEVSDVLDRLTPIYEECDPADLEQILIKSLPLFERHWKEALSTVTKTSGRNHSKSPVAVMDVSESQAAEPLLSYYNHGRLSAKYRHGNGSGIVSDVMPSSGKPYVCFGSRTCDVGETTASSAVTLKNPGLGGEALHMVMHLVAPKKPISCIRTYFLAPTEERRKRESDLLIDSYAVCVEACEAGILEYCKNLNPGKAKQAADHILAKACSLNSTSTYKSKLEAFGNSGKPLPLTEGPLSFHIKTMTASIEKIKSADGNTVLGSVSFADTFIESTVQTVKRADEGVSTGGENVSHSTDHVVLTKGIPRFIQWKTNHSDVDLSSPSIASLNNVTFCSSSSLLRHPSMCDVEFFKDGSMIFSPHDFPSFTLTPSLLDDVGYYDTGLPNAVTLLQFDVKLSPALPSILQGKEKFALAFFPLSSSTKLFSSQVLPRLEELSKANSLKFTQLGRVSDELAASYTAVQANYMWLAGISHRNDNRSSKLTVSTPLLQPRLTDFMKKFGVGFVLSGKRLPEVDLSSVLECEHDVGNGDAPQADKVQDSKVCISVIIGLPGCHGDRLCASLVDLHRERVRWVVVRVQSKMGDATLVDEDHLQRQLSDFVAKRRASRPGAAATKRLRVVVEVTGFFDVASVVSCVINHRDPDTRGRMFIGAVTVCLNPLACYIEHSTLLPKVMEQCSAGIVSCVAFTGAVDDLKDKNLAAMQLMVRDVNPNAAFLLAAKGHTSRTGDFDLVLSDDSFESTENRSLRHLALPGLWNNSFRPGVSPLKINDVTLQFSQPLLKGTLSAKLRALRHAMAGYPYTGNVYMVKGVLAFTDSPDQLSDLCFVSRTAQLTLETRAQPQVKAPAPPTNKNSAVSKPYHLHFYGIGICQESLREWLRKSGRQRPSRKCQRTKSSLSPAELKRLQTSHQNDPLPEGIFYNGAQYCSLIDNSRSNDHPYLDRFIDEYLEKENAEIDAYNARLDAQHIRDLFD